MTVPADSNAAQRIWRRTPVIIRAIITGSLVAVIGTTPWAVLVSANMKHWPTVPWAVLPAVVYLWLYWRYVQGEGPPGATVESRRSNSRAHRLPENVWGSALLAGIFGLASVVLLQHILNRLVRLPQQQAPEVSQLPMVTLVSFILASALVAGVAEEVSFRGYMQKPIERRHGPVIAVLVTGIFFAFAHFGHPEVTVILIPYYVAVAAVYGALAYFTDSIFPGMVLHAGGNILGSIDLLGRGHSEWQAFSTPRLLVWETGADLSFWLSVLALIVVAGVTIQAYRSLRNIARAAREPT